MRAILPFLIAVSSFGQVSRSQCDLVINHTNGSMMIDSVLVDVNSSGFADTFNTYCPATTPYFLGYDRQTSTDGNGSYTFQFTPPVYLAELNFSGITNTATSKEFVTLMVNGTPYAIDSVGIANGCDSLAELTPAGNIVGCQGCGVSGWSGTLIEGPISTLTVKDSVIMGAPGGMLFSLSVCKEQVEEVDEPQECMMGIPSAFSPNRDGYNDHFAPISRGECFRYQFKVFNRWGECVFEAHNPSMSWDGNYKGKPSPAAVYAYTVMYSSEPSSEVIRRSGTVTLVR